MYLFARVRTVRVVQWLARPRKMHLVSPLWYVLVPLVQCLGRTGNVPICPCPYSVCCTVARLAAESVPSFSALVRTGTPCTVLGPHGQCTYSSVPTVRVVQWLAWPRKMYLVSPLWYVLVPLVQCLVRTGHVPICPCPYCAGTVVQCFAWSARAMYHLPGLVLVLISLFLYDYVASRNLDFLLIKT